MKHYESVPSYKLEITILDSLVTSLTLRVMISNQRDASWDPKARVRWLKVGVARLKAQIGRLKPRVEAIKTRVR